EPASSAARLAMRMRRLPYMSPRRPAIGVVTAPASRAAVTGQAASVTEVSRISGRVGTSGMMIVCISAAVMPVIDSTAISSAGEGAGPRPGARASSGRRIVTGLLSRPPMRVGPVPGAQAGRMMCRAPLAPDATGARRGHQSRSRRADTAWAVPATPGAGGACACRSGRGGLGGPASAQRAAPGAELGAQAAASAGVEVDDLRGAAVDALGAGLGRIVTAGAQVLRGQRHLGDRAPGLPVLLGERPRGVGQVVAIGQLAHPHRDLAVPVRRDVREQVVLDLVAEVAGPEVHDRAAVDV